MTKILAILPLFVNIVLSTTTESSPPTTVTETVNYYTSDDLIYEQPVDDLGPSLKLAPEEMPYFVETLSSQNVTVNPGEIAVISCVVRNLGDHLVIWRRSDQLVPLTIGRTRHVLDDRFTADANLMTGEWSLIIRDARISDSATYRCQVNAILEDNTYLERHVTLRVRDVPIVVIDAREAVRSDWLVVEKLSSMTSLPKPVLFELLSTIKHKKEAMASVFATESLMTSSNKPKYKATSKMARYTLAGDLSIGGTDYVDRGQNIELSCNATWFSSSSQQIERAPNSVEWFKDGEKLESSHETGYFITKHAVGRILYSNLIVYKAELKHAGDYVCRVADLNAVESVKVTVLNVQPGTVKRGTSAISIASSNNDQQSSASSASNNSWLTMIIGVVYIVIIIM